MAATISTFEAVSPAIARTRAILFRDFRFWRFLKLTFVAGLSQYPILNLFFGILIYGSILTAVAYCSVSIYLHAHPGNGTALVVGVILLVILLLLAIAFGFAYLFTRLRMAMIGVLATEDTEIRPAMREFGRKTWSYLGLIFVVLLLLLVPLTLILVPAGYHFFEAFRQIAPQLNQPHGTPPPAGFIPLIISLELGLYAAIFLVIIILRLAETTTRDIMMIPMALEEASAGESFGFLRGLFQVERGRTLGHILFHALLEFAGAMIAVILAYLPAVILGLLGALIGFGLANGLWHNGPGGQVLVIAYAVTAALIFIAVFVALLTATIGTAAIFTQSHALEYLSPRYLPLNALMNPTAFSTLESGARISPFPAPPQEPPPAGTF
jgi:hypothetical protein